MQRKVTTVAIAPGKPANGDLSHIEKVKDDKADANAEQVPLQRQAGCVRDGTEERSSTIRLRSCVFVPCCWGDEASAGCWVQYVKSASSVDRSGTGLRRQFKEARCPAAAGRHSREYLKSQ